MDTPNEAAAVSMEELNRDHELKEAKRKTDTLMRASMELMEYEPKIAAALAGKGHKAMVVWSKMVEAEDPQEEPSPAAPAPTVTADPKGEDGLAAGPVLATEGEE